jgi:cytochrome P450
MPAWGDTRAFTRRSVGALRSTAADLAATAVAAGRDGGNLLSASSLGTRLICRLLGVPDADDAGLTKWAEALSPVFGVMTPRTDRRRHHGDHRNAGLRRRIDDPARQGSRDDLVTSLLSLGTIPRVARFRCSILVALQHRDELDGVLEDGARFTGAVNEAMRLEPIIPAIPRTAVAPIDLRGMTIPAGSMVCLCIAAACRDASAWSEPGRYDPERFTRPDAPKLLNFGAGTRYRLGTALAKVAVDESVRAVLAADPPLGLTEDPAEIPWR